MCLKLASGSQPGSLSVCVPSLCQIIFMPIITLPLLPCCRCTEQPSSFMSLTQRRTCRSVSAPSLVCPALILDLMGPGVFTATRASVSSPTGPSSSPSGAFSHSSTDTPSLDHMPCLLKSSFFCFYFLTSLWFKNSDLFLVLETCLCALLIDDVFTHRHISHFMQTVPFPSTQRPRILVQVRLKRSYLVMTSLVLYVGLVWSGINFSKSTLVMSKILQPVKL